MDRGVERWIYLTARKNHWRVAAWYDISDLIQDGFMVYYRTLARYACDVPGERRLEKTARTQREIMALFKTCYTNHIHNLATRKTRQLDFPAEFFPDDRESEDAALATFIAEAPPFIAKLIHSLLNADGELLRARPRRRRDGSRETTHERMCRLAGIRPSEAHAVASLLKAFLTRGMT